MANRRITRRLSPGITKDITLVLDGQQRIASLFIGLRGSYRHFYYRWRLHPPYLNILLPPVPDEDNPQATYQFAFREDAEREGDDPPSRWRQAAYWISPDAASCLPSPSSRIVEIQYAACQVPQLRIIALRLGVLSERELISQFFRIVLIRHWRLQDVEIRRVEPPPVVEVAVRAT